MLYFSPPRYCHWWCYNVGSTVWGSIRRSSSPQINSNSRGNLPWYLRSECCGGSGLSRYIHFPAQRGYYPPPRLLHNTYLVRMQPAWVSIEHVLPLNPAKLLSTAGELRIKYYTWYPTVLYYKVEMGLYRAANRGGHGIFHSCLDQLLITKYVEPATLPTETQPLSVVVALVP